MMELNTHQTQTVSGGAEAVYYYQGLSYNLECPNVSQTCLDHYLSHVKKTDPSVSPLNTSVQIVLKKCLGLEGVFQVSLCLKPIEDDVRAKLQL